MSEIQGIRYENEADAETRSVSGFVIDELEGVSGEFTQFTELPSSGHNTLARAKRYGRWFLLKGLKSDVADELLMRKSLLKEFDIMMRLDHPGVVQAVGLEEVPGRGQCIVVEWVEGMTLKQWLSQNPSPRESSKMLDQILDAVEYVHSQGVVHRDLKPSNMMVSNVSKQIKLIDFGLADNDVHAVLKQPGGTVEYMAPEQFSGSVPDVRNDIYSLGVIMRKMPLGRKYRGAIMKCLGPIEERFGCVDDLRKYLHRADSIRRYSFVALVAAVVLALVCVVTWQQVALNKMNHQSELIADSLRRQMADNTLQTKQNQTQIDKTTEQTQKHISALNDSLVSVTRDNNMLHEREQSRQARQKVVDAAIARGISIVDDANRKSKLINHLDTLSSLRYLWIDWRDLAFAGRKASSEYVASIKSDYSIKEIAEIDYALKEYCNDYENKIVARASKFDGGVCKLPTPLNVNANR